MLPGGCASSDSFVPIPVQLPQDCELLAEQVPEPRYRDNEDFRAIAVRYKRAWLLGNERIVATRDCQAVLREKLAGQVTP